MTHYAYVIAEGPQDSALLAKLARAAFAFQHVREHSELDVPLASFVDGFKYPHRKKIFPLAVPAPLFLRNRDSSQWLVLACAGGEAEIVNKLDADRIAFEKEESARFEAVGIVLDADVKEPPVQRFKNLAQKVAGLGMALPVDAEVVAGDPRTGVFVMPGGGAPGTLEDLLLECATRAYPNLTAAARSFVDGINETVLDSSAPERGELRKPAGAKKATVSAIASILKPGKALAATLEDHRWICDVTRAEGYLKRLQSFLSAILDLEPTVIRA